MGNGVRRYSPCASDIVVTLPTCSAGLVAVIVTPGTPSPLSSLSWPTILASVCCAAATPPNAATSRSAAKHTASPRPPRTPRDTIDMLSSLLTGYGPVCVAALISSRMFGHVVLLGDLP